MNTLTKNRIIERGDEWKDENGKWYPVHTAQIGLQVMFSKYKEVRRPSEIPFVAADRETANSSGTKCASAQSAVTTPPSPENITLTPVESKPPAKPYPFPKIEDIKIVENKAAMFPEGSVAVESKLSVTAEIAKAHGFKPISEWKASEDTHILYPSTPGGTTPPVWTGRNGTFHATGLLIERVNGDIMRLVPSGKRGIAKNARIEFPVTIIPQIVEWLNKQRE